MNPSVDWIRLARYLSEECSEEEVADIESRILIDPAYRGMISLMKEVWKIEEDPPQTWDMKNLWENISIRAGFTAGRYKDQTITGS